MSKPFPRFRRFSAIISLSKLTVCSPSLLLAYWIFWICLLNGIPLLMGGVGFLLFFKICSFLSSALFQSSYPPIHWLFLPSGLFCYRCSLLHSSSSFTELFTSRISIWFFFYNFDLFGKNSFWSYSLFLISLNCLLEFSCNSLSFFIATILNSL